MKVEVEFFGPILRPKGAGAQLTVSLPDGASVADLLAHLGYQATQMRFLSVLQDGRRLPLSTVLREGASVAIAAPLGGG